MLFALRALVPVGFMVAAGTSGAAVVLCPDFGPTAGAPHAHHHHHHPHAGGGTDTSGAADPVLTSADGHGICPFGAAGHLAWHLPGSAGPAPAVDAAHALATGVPQRAVAGPRFYLSQAPRAPPRDLV